MTMVKRKVTQDDEHFVHKTKWVSTSTKKTVEIHDFISKIEDGDNSKNEINSPEFELEGVNFYISVYPDKGGSGFIGVYLYNDDIAVQDQTISISVQEGSGFVEEKSSEMAVVEADDDWGFSNFMSHEKFRELAKVHGDVLKLEVVVTLHTKAKGNSWTR